MYFNLFYRKLFKAFLILLLSINCLSLTQAQSNITLQEPNTSRLKAMALVQQQCKCKIDFTALPDKENLSLQLDKVHFTTAMGVLLSESGYTYRMDNQKITIVKIKQQSLSGVILDASNGEGLPAASAFIKATNKGVTADMNGRFSLKPAKGIFTIDFSYVGYVNQEVYVDGSLVFPEIVVRLSSDNMLDGATISAIAKDANITKTTMGVERMTAIAIKKMPALMGEADPLKAIQLLPGVQTASEGGSGFSVRGSSPDQNLILLDNAVVYNASHMLGFFSVFNNDIVNSLDLYKGDLPLKHGGRLASLLDITTLNNSPTKFSGTGGLGLISSRLMLQAPIGDKTDVLISGRRSYADLFLKLSSDENLNQSVVYFYDMNAKVNHRISDRDRISLSGYYGKDRFGTNFSNFDYGNATATLNWSHIFNDRLYANFSANYSSYRYMIGADIDNFSVEWKSSINDIQARADFNYKLNDRNTLTFGLVSTYHSFKPGNVKSNNIVLDIPKNNALENALYVSNEQKFGEKIVLKYGVRWATFQNVGPGTVFHYDKDYESIDSTTYSSGNIYHTYHAVEPRIGAVYLLNKQSSIKANFAMNSQFIQLANSSASGSPLDIWFSAGPNIKPQQVSNFSLGYFRNFKDNLIEFSGELYYKDLKNVIDFQDHADLILNEKIDGEVRIGKGKAYGLELMVKKNTGKLTGFVNYTISRTERTIAEINDGKTYLAPYDKPHVVNVVLNYEFSKKWNVSANWIFARGNPTTYPTGRFEIDGDYYPVYSGRNEYRKPNYTRLDLSVNFTPKPNSTKRWKGDWNFSLYNAYGRKNPWLINFKQEAETGKPYAESTYLFGIVPSITYNFKF